MNESSKTRSDKRRIRISRMALKEFKESRCPEVARLMIGLIKLVDKTDNHEDRQTLLAATAFLGKTFGASPDVQEQ